MAELLSSQLQERAQRALACCPVPAVRELRVDHVGDLLVIAGQVSSFYHKQLAQEAMRAVAKASAIEVLNLVEVV